jgi:hypothetical protein
MPSIVGQSLIIEKGVGSFWWRDIMSLTDNYFMLASCEANMGDTMHFWRDTWNLRVLQSVAELALNLTRGHEQ